MGAAAGGIAVGGKAAATDGASPAAWLAGVVARATLTHLLVLAMALRLAALAIATPIHSDEVFSYLETPHRLLFGEGVVTWEWRYGIRGWLLPLLVGAPMGLGGWIAPGTTLYLFLPKLVMTLASLTTVMFAWRLGERVSRLHAQAAGAVAAIWCEFILFAPHVLSDTASIACFLPAALILTDRDERRPGRLALAAALLANAAAIRFQLGPAIATLVVATCAGRLRQTWAPLLLGGVLGLVPSALADLSMGQTPFAWILENVRMNIVEHRAADWSASGPLGYFAEAWPRLTFWVVPLVVLAGIGARRFPALAWTAVVNVVAHSLIAHKEYRYILLSVVIAVVLAAIGTVDWATRSPSADQPAAARRRLGLACLVWLLASLSCGLGGYRIEWSKWRPTMDLELSLQHDPALCGLALYRHDFGYTGGYTYLHRPTPLYYYVDGDTNHPWSDFAGDTRMANTVMTRAFFRPQVPAQYTELRCEGAGILRVCLYRRPGGCASGPSPFAIQTVLRRLDQ
jgi:hypothetical protein